MNYAIPIRLATVAALAAATVVQPAWPGGEFVRLMPTSPRIEDMSAAVEANCSQRRVRTLTDGTLLEVLFAPELESQVDYSATLMEETHDALVTVLGSTPKATGRLFLVRLTSYPESMRVVDQRKGTPTWAFVRLKDNEAVMRTLIE